MIPEPGIYRDVPFDDYLRWEAISNSSLSAAMRSMLHYRHQKLIVPTDAMTFGTLCHTGKLEPDAVLKRYVVMPDMTIGVVKADGTPASNPTATSEYKRKVKAFIEEHAGRKVVSEEQFARMLGVVNAINENALAREMLCAEGESELSVVWNDDQTGLLCKCRVDKVQLAKEKIADLKTTGDAQQFEHSIYRYGYDRQAAFYIDGVEMATGVQCDFSLVVVESDRPHGVMAAPMGKRTVDRGRSLYKKALRDIANARATRTWAGYISPPEWNVPEYKLAQDNDAVELIINGEVLSV